jgi:hypothetical protein
MSKRELLKSDLEDIEVYTLTVNIAMDKLGCRYLVVGVIYYGKATF